MEERLQALNANKSPIKIINNIERIELTGLNPFFFHIAFIFSFTKYRKEIIMIDIIIALVALVAMVCIGFVVAYNIYEKEFWDRQDFMEKINRLF